MSRINLHNYEAFLLDLAEGTITPADEQKLMLFLNEHPELDVDIDGIAYATLDDEGITFSGKDELKKNGSDARFDVLAVKQMEEGLTPAENAELDAIVATDTKYGIALAAYSKTILVADKAIVFDGKGSLKQGAAIRPLWYYASAAAAAVALLVGIYVFNQQNAGLTQPVTAEGAKNNTVKKDSVIEKQPPAYANAAPAVTKPIVVGEQVTKSKNNQPVVAPVINNEPVYTKSTPVIVEPVTPVLAAVMPVSNGYNDMMASAFVLPVYGIDEPQPKQNLLNTLLAKARIGIKQNVKDNEMAARLDTITKRGPKFSDLAFLGSKGIERLTGVKPNIHRVEDEEKNTSALVIGRYTIITSRKNR